MIAFVVRKFEWIFLFTFLRCIIPPLWFISPARPSILPLRILRRRRRRRLHPNLLHGLPFFAETRCSRRGRGAVGSNGLVICCSLRCGSRNLVWLCRCQYRRRYFRLLIPLIKHRRRSRDCHRERRGCRAPSSAASKGVIGIERRRSGVAL